MSDATSSDNRLERDPAEIEPTDNSSGAVPDPERVADAEREAAELEAETETEQS